MFITLYGINNIGKTTHAKRLVDRLTGLGKKAVYIKFPVYDEKPTGPLLNSILRKSAVQKIREEELQLWFVLNRYQFQRKLKKLLDSGIIVIAEDYVGTAVAWGTAKGGDGKELVQMNAFLIKPNCEILIDGERALRSREKGHIHEENDLIAARCQRIFRRLAQKNKWKKVELSADRDVTAARLWTIVARML